MKRAWIAAALAGLSVAGLAAPAIAAPGYALGNVYMRSGPGVQYPSVAMLPAGASVEIIGCLVGESWCDISSGPVRGWVSGNFLGQMMGGQPLVMIQPSYPVVVFNITTYWDNYYRDRPFYPQRPRYEHRPAHIERPHTVPHEPRPQHQAAPRPSAPVQGGPAVGNGDGSGHRGGSPHNRPTGGDRDNRGGPGPDRH